MAVGIYAAVLYALNHMDKGLLLVAKDDVDNRSSIPLAIETACRFHIEKRDAGQMVGERVETVKIRKEKITGQIKKNRRFKGKTQKMIYNLHYSVLY